MSRKITVVGLNAATAVTEARAAAEAAEAARDAAVDISNISTSDEVVEALIEGTGGAGPLTRAALSDSYMEREGDHAGPDPYFEYSTLGAGAVLHLLTGVTSTAPYVLGIGVDHDNSPTGLVTSVKGNNSTGVGATLETTSGSGSEGILCQTFSSGKLLRLVAGSTATGDMIAIESTFGGTSKMLTWDTTVNDGEISANGNVLITGGTSEVAVQHASTNQNRLRQRVTSGATIVDFDHYAGSSLWFAHRIDTSSNSLRFRKGTAAAALGAATYSTLFELKDANAMGFFGVTPVTRRTLGAAATDAATTQTLANNIRQALIDLGLGQT